MMLFSFRTVSCSPPLNIQPSCRLSLPSLPIANTHPLIDPRLSTRQGEVNRRLTRQKRQAMAMHNLILHI